MPWKSTGAYVVVGTAGTPVRLASQRVPCHTVFVQQHASNVGKLYLMSISGGGNGLPAITAAQLSASSGVGVVATIPAPTVSGGIGVILPWVAYTIPYAPGGGNLADFYLDADSSSDKATVSVIVA